MVAPAIEVADLTMHYGERVAVDGISFRVVPGEVVALLGPNGAGKTSTIEALEGYRRPTSGVVRVLGLDPRRDHARVVPRLGVMLQEGGIAPGMRVGEVLHLYAAYYDDPLDPEALLGRLGLTDLRRSTWRRLSGGERQRLSLALALIGRPEVVFLDEPTAGVDVTGRRIIRDVVAELRADGAAVLLATHELDEAERLADRVVIVDRGRVVAEGTVAELTHDNAGDEVRFSAPSGLQTKSLAHHLDAPVAEPTPGEYRIDAAGTPEIVAALSAWLADHQIPLGDLRVGRSRLEDVFLRLTDDHGVER